ncbi:hypothetical protein ACQKEX_14920 [Bacillus pumilus]|nr:hypothetical protein [Bacillus pumilus]MBU8576375.1 hypothetical protein [Bacillus pumilus]
MAVRPVPDMETPQNIGFVEGDTSPIIHSIRWRHLPARYIFNSVGDVISYHNKGPLEIDIFRHSASYLDIYLLREDEERVQSITANLRYAREGGQLIEEPYTVGEAGRSIRAESDSSNPKLLVVKGIVFTQKDLNDGSPLYDFMNMAEEGIYELWLNVKTVSGKELNVRIPFVWANLKGSVPGEDGEEPGDSGGNGSDRELHALYDEYYLTIIEGDSPFTKKPSTQYRMAAVGMLKEPYCFERISTPPLPSIEKPTDTIVVGDVVPPQCGLKLRETTVRGLINEELSFELIHSNTSGIRDIHYNYDETEIEQTDETKFKLLKQGSSKVTIVVTYNDGQECSVVGYFVTEFKCAFAVTASNTGTIEVGDTVNFTYSHGVNKADLRSVVLEAPDGVEKVSNSRVRLRKEGSYRIRFVADYGNGNECEVYLNITVSKASIPDPNGGGDDPGNGGGTDPGGGKGGTDPRPNEPTKELKCGQAANGSLGYGAFTHNVNETGTYFVEFNFFGEPDEMHLYIGGKHIYSTGQQLYENGSPFGFKYKPSQGKIKIVMNDGGKGTRWSYTLYCPSSVPAGISGRAHIVN